MSESYSSQAPALLWGRFTLGALALMPLIAVLAPRFLAYGPGAIALLAALSYPFIFKERLTLSRPAFALAGGLTVLAALSSLWAIDSTDALERTGKLALVLLPGALLLSVVQAMPLKIIKQIVLLFISVFAVSLGLMVIELSLNAPLYHVFHGLKLDESINMSVLNRSAVALLFLLPAMIALLPCVIMQQPRVGQAVLLALFLPLFLLTESQSVQLAFILGAGATFAFPYRLKIFWALLAALTILYVMAMPWIAINAFNFLAPMLDDLPFLGRGDGYAGARLEIWDFVARYALQKPWTGFGIEATRMITDFDTQKLYHAGGTILHPHNMAIQFWIEFGVIGALIGSMFLSAIIWLMATKLSPAQARIALPSFIMALSIGSMTYGIWQGWWLGALFLSAGFVMMAIRLTGEDKSHD